MPEWAEVKIMSDKINSLYEHIEYDKMYVNSKTKQEQDFSKIVDNFTISSETYGKELILRFNDTHDLVMNMGMSGSWVLTIEPYKSSHTMLQFEGIRKSTGVRYYLSFMDVRRFAKWKWGTYSTNRGKDPVRDFEKWVDDLRTKKIPDKPIYEVMLNQSLFNGVGNYLRAIILNEMDINPFISAKEYIPENLDRLCEITKNTMMTAYELHGGSFKGWTNPNGYRTLSNDFYYPYGQGEKIKDKGGRVFWYDSKWEDEKKKFFREDI